MLHFTILVHAYFSLWLLDSQTNSKTLSKILFKVNLVFLWAGYGYGGTTWNSSLGAGVEPAREQYPTTGFMVEYNDQSCFTSLAQHKKSSKATKFLIKNLDQVDLQCL